MFFKKKHSSASLEISKSVSTFDGVDTGARHKPNKKLGKKTEKRPSISDISANSSSRFSHDEGYEGLMAGRVGTTHVKKSSKQSKKGSMKPREKERLSKNRGMMVRTLDMSVIMDDMRRTDTLSKKDEESIMEDPRRRQRAARFLDILEGKKTVAYDAFVESLGEHYPQLYLQLVDWEEDDDESNPRGDDEWTRLRKMRRMLIDDMDASKVIPYLKEKEVLSDREVREILKAPSGPRCTESLLDVLETKSSTAYELFLEITGEMFPHLYLLLTEREDDLDDL